MPLSRIVRKTATGHIHDATVGIAQFDAGSGDDAADRRDVRSGGRTGVPNRVSILRAHREDKFVIVPTGDGVLQQRRLRRHETPAGDG